MRSLFRLALIAALAACSPSAPNTSTPESSSRPARPGKYRATAVLELLPAGLAPGGVTADDRYVATALTKLQRPGFLALIPGDPHRGADLSDMDPAEIRRLVDGRVGWERLRGTYLLEISVDGDDPRLVDDLANLCAAAFAADLARQSTDRHAERRMELEEGIARTNTKIRLLEVDKRGALEMADFMESTFEAEYARIQASRDKYAEAKEDALWWVLENEARRGRLVKALNDGDAGPATLLDDPEILGDEVVAACLRNERTLRAELELLKEAGRGALHEDTKRLQLQIRSAQARSFERARQIAEASVRRHAERSELVDRFDAKVMELTTALREATAVKAQVDQLRAAIDRHSEDKRRLTVELERLTPAVENLVRVVRQATEPSLPR